MTESTDTLKDVRRYLESVQESYSGGIPVSSLVVSATEETSPVEGKSVSSEPAISDIQVRFVVDHELDAEERGLLDAIVAKGLGVDFDKIELSIAQDAETLDSFVADSSAMTPVIYLGITPTTITNFGYHDHKGIPLVLGPSLFEMIQSGQKKKDFWIELKKFIRYALS